MPKVKSYKKVKGPGKVNKGSGKPTSKVPGWIKGQYDYIHKVKY